MTKVVADEVPMCLQSLLSFVVRHMCLMYVWQFCWSVDNFKNLWQSGNFQLEAGS